jgi:hypothetical protein
MTLAGQEFCVLGKLTTIHVDSIASRVAQAYYPAVHIRHQIFVLSEGRPR